MQFACEMDTAIVTVRSNRLPSLESDPSQSLPIQPTPPKPVPRSIRKSYRINLRILRSSKLSFPPALSVIARTRARYIRMRIGAPASSTNATSVTSYTVHAAAGMPHLRPTTLAISQTQSAAGAATVSTNSQL